MYNIGYLSLIESGFMICTKLYLSFSCKTLCKSRPPTLSSKASKHKKRKKKSHRLFYTLDLYIFTLFYMYNAAM